MQWVEEFDFIVKDFTEKIMKSKSKEELLAMKQIIDETWFENAHRVSKEDMARIFIPLKERWFELIDERLLEWKN